MAQAESWPWPGLSQQSSSVTVTPIKFPGRSSGGEKKNKTQNKKTQPFITHSHKTQVFPTKQYTVKCFRTAKASELMVHWNKNRGSREENMRLPNPWGRNPICACTVCDGACVQPTWAERNNKSRKRSKTNGLASCWCQWMFCLNEKQPGSGKLKLAISFNLIGPQAYATWGCRSTSVYCHCSGSRAFQPSRTQAKPENLINCGVFIRKTVALVGKTQ